MEFPEDFFVVLRFDAGANPETIGKELWRTDGTADGTVQLIDLDTFCCSPAGSSSPRSLKVYDGELFFVADDGITGSELWKTDGTVPGTVRIKDIFPGSPGAIRSDLFELNGELYFSAAGEFTGVELWKSDGTELGTVRVRDIAIGSISSSPTLFVVF